MMKVFHGDGLNTVRTPYVSNRWVKIQARIDLDHDWTRIYYDETLVTQYPWTGGVLGGGGGSFDVAALDLYANGASSVYYDDVRIERIAPCPGDLNGDRQADLSDLAALLSHLGQVSGATLAMGDADGDGDVELSDLAIFLAAFGTMCP